MANRGIVYVMSCTQGLLKIGCTQTDQFENRMRNLESDGYKQFNGFHREFAVEVDDYQKKEHLIHRLFDKSQVKINGRGIEMFATDLDLVIDLMKAFGGKQVYPSAENLADAPHSERRRVSVPAAPIAPRLTLEELHIPVGSELKYTLDPSVTAITADMKNKVTYNGKTYTVSGLVKELKHGGSWNGFAYFTYNGKTLADLRKEMWADG